MPSRASSSTPPVKLQEELACYALLRETVVTVGVFDGVHRGHQHLLAHLKERAASGGLLSGVVTFRNHPRTVLHPEHRVSYLTTPEERIERLREVGVDLVWPITFDREVSLLSARAFVGLLRKHVRMKAMVIGPDFALGYRREGDAETLTALGREMGFSVEVVQPLVEGDLVVSSTSIREALAGGNVALVASLLGRNFSLKGTVSGGAGRGRKLGFPTANVEVPEEMAIPGDGIYATWAYVDRRRFMSATSIGVRPTFGAGERTVEAFLMDFQGDLYGKELRLEFVSRLRDELRFESVEQLRDQMARDVEHARAVLVGLDRTLKGTASKKRTLNNAASLWSLTI